jgi:NTE family protein
MYQNLKLLIITVLFLITSCTTYRSVVEVPQLPPPPRKIENVKIALVLGGGGVKGLAHVGVLEVLEQYNIPIDLIVGTSSGSIVGSMYADYKDYQMVYDALINLKSEDLIDFSFFDALSFFSDFKGPIQGYFLQDFILKNVSAYNIEDLKIPFVAVTTELKSGKVYSFSSGPVALGVAASSSIPPIFSPIIAYDRVFVDGGVLEPVPVSTAKLYKPKLIIAVDITTSGNEFEINNMLDVMNKSMYLNYYQLSKSQSQLADVIIHPNLAGIGLFEDHNNVRLYTIGKLAALKSIPEILNKMSQKGINPKLRQ